MKRIRTTLFNIDIERRDPYVGAMLVAEPFLKESYFNHAVVTVVNYSKEEGALGLVMNHLTTYKMPDILEQVVRNEHTEAIPVFSGGPVADDRLFYLHTLGPEVVAECMHVKGDLYVGGDFNDILAYINSGYPTEGKIRFFIGYSGWTPGQLEEELDNNVWAVADTHGPSSAMLRGADDAYWHRTVRAMGDRYRGWLYHPMDVHAN